MPLVHERTFRVRHYECDAYGHVNHANYLRYMQEAAMDASAAAGYDLARYAELGTLWFIRETEIRYFRPLVYGDAVTVKTWVEDFRRVQSRRAYDLYHTATGERVAQGHSDWVYLDAATLRPTPIDAAMQRAFFPEGPPVHPLKREPFPDVPAPPPGVFTMRRQVEWNDLDSAGHVNNAMYLTYLEECVVRAVDAFGWPMNRIADEGFGIVARRYRIAYQQAAQLGDELAIATWVASVRQSSAERCYTITRAADHAELVRALVRWVWVDLATGQPIRIPPHFLADFTPNLGEGVSVD